jgi:DNA-binding beta-propeller fold protein YncE
MIVSAPELVGHGGWIGVEEDLSLRALRGKVLVLHFWAFSDAKCLRMAGELADLQRRFPTEVAVIGVHSPKFPYCGEHEAVIAAVARHRISYPVLDDPDMVTWQQYGVRGWPTVVVIDPRSHVVGALPGDEKIALLHQIVQDLVEQHRGKTRLARHPISVTPPPQLSRRRPGSLCFPGKVATDRRGRLAIADTGNDRVLVVQLHGERARTTHVVTGLSQPQGVRLYGSDLVICDTGHDRVVALDLSRRPGASEVIAPDPAGITRLRVLPSEVIAFDLAGPWDVVADVDRSYVVAEAARQRLWRIPTDGSSPAVIAGDEYEGLADGPGAEAELAQPSGLSRLPNGIAFVDAESSALRLLDGRGRVGTLVGLGLFDWGRRDGRPSAARLQHPQGVVADLDGTSLFVADTYNHALRWWRDGRLGTVPIDGLREPSGLDVLPDGRLVVADSGNHRIVVVDPADGSSETLHFETVELPAAEPAMVWGAALGAAAGTELIVPFTLDPAPLALDPSGGAPVRVDIGSEPTWLLDHGPTAWVGWLAAGELRLRAGSGGSGTLTVTVTAAVAGDGVVSTARSLTQHPLVIS